MPNYPIFYSIQKYYKNITYSNYKQNDKDMKKKVAQKQIVLNRLKQDKQYLNIQNNQLRLKHIIKEFPLDLENESFHIRFKIQCNEIDPKMYAWIDPSNLEARAPLINNAVYAKLIRLSKEGDSKLFNKQKIQKAKASITNQESNSQRKEPQQITSKAKQAVQHQHGLPHANSDPDLVHNKHMKNSNLLDSDFKDSKFKQKSTNNLDSQTKQQQGKVTRDLFDEDFDEPKNKTKQLINSFNQNQQQLSNSKSAPKSANIDFFGSDDEDSKPSGSANTFGSNSKPQTNYNGGQDLLFDDGPSQQMVFGKHENLIQDHNQAPQSEFDQILKSREHEYIINGEMDGKRLKQIKQEILEYLQEKQVQLNQQEIEKKEREQVEKKDAKEKLQQKVTNWKEQNGTRKDIRTLLSTLQNVLWTGANWTPVSFFDLSTEESLKSTIKKVLIKFHPDRNRDSIENKFICEQIIDEIKQAQKEYDSKQNK